MFVEHIQHSLSRRTHLLERVIVGLEDDDRRVRPLQMPFEPAQGAPLGTFDIQLHERDWVVHRQHPIQWARVDRHQRPAAVGRLRPRHVAADVEIGSELHDPPFVRSCQPVHLQAAPDSIPLSIPLDGFCSPGKRFEADDRAVWSHSMHRGVREHPDVCTDIDNHIAGT